MSNVVVKPNEPIDSALKRFKKKCERDGIVKEWKRHSFFTKPSAARREKRKAAERKRLKKTRQAKRRRR